MAWLMLIASSFAQDYSGRSDEAWMDQVTMADFELAIWQIAIDGMVITADDFQSTAFASMEAGGTGQEHLPRCKELLATTESMGQDLASYSEVYGPQWTWASNNMDAISPSVRDAVRNTLDNEHGVYTGLIRAQHSLGSTCMLAAMMSDDAAYASQLAREEMAIVEGSLGIEGVDHDTALMASITVAEAFTLPELKPWLDLSDAHCISADCAEFAQELRAANFGTTPPPDVDVDEGSPGLLSLIHRDVTVGYNYIGATHQLGLQGRTGVGPLAVRGGYVYGFDASHGWNVKLGVEKWWGQMGQVGLGARGVIDAYGADHSVYTLDRTLGAEVPVGLRVHLGKATLGVNATPRWNRTTTRRSAELPSWLHELHTQAYLSYRLSLVTLVVTGEWAQTGGGTLWGPTVGLRF